MDHFCTYIYYEPHDLKNFYGQKALNYLIIYLCFNSYPANVENMVSS